MVEPQFEVCETMQPLLLLGQTRSENMQAAQLPRLGSSIVAGGIVACCEHLAVTLQEPFHLMRRSQSVHML